MAGFEMYLQETDRYANVMDSTEEENGVNNYAASVLQALNGHSNRSKEWSSCLSNEKSVMKLPFVQKFLQDGKVCICNSMLCVVLINDLV